MIYSIEERLNGQTIDFNVFEHEDIGAALEAANGEDEYVAVHEAIYDRFIRRTLHDAETEEWFDRLREPGRRRTVSFEIRITRHATATSTEVVERLMEETYSLTD